MLVSSALKLATAKDLVDMWKLKLQAEGCATGVFPQWTRGSPIRLQVMGGTQFACMYLSAVLGCSPSRAEALERAE